MSKSPFDPADPFGYARLAKLCKGPDISNLSAFAKMPDLTEMVPLPLNHLAALPDRSTSYDRMAGHREALALLNSNWLRGNRLLAYDPVAFPNVASAMSAVGHDVIDSLGASLPKQPLPSGAWGVDKAFHVGRDLEALFNPPDALKIDEFSSPHGADIAQRISDRLGWTLPAPYAQQLKSFFEDIDLGAIQIAAFDARHRVQQGLPDSARVRSFSDIEEAFRTDDLADLRQVVDEAVASAIDKAAREGRLGGKPLPRFLLQVLMNIIFLVAGIWAAPVYDDWYRARKPPAPTVAHGPRKTQAHAPRLIVVVTATRLHLRLGPHTTQRIVATVEHGQLLYVEGKKHGWARVRYVDPLGDGASVTGWVKVQYTKSLEAETTELIVRSLASCTEGDDTCDGAE